MYFQKYISDTFNISFSEISIYSTIVDHIH